MVTMIFRRWLNPVIDSNVSFSRARLIKSVHHQILLCGCFFVIGSLCPIIFFHTHFAKEYTLKNYSGDLHIFLNGRHIVVKALVDTGNHLYEPLTGKPVCLVEYESLKACLDRGKTFQNVRAIPYHSLGKEHGMLWGVTAEKLIFRNHRQKIEQSGCIIGIYPEKISKSGDFNAILHPDILNK